MSHYDELPTWLAWPVAATLPSEGAVSVEAARGVLQSYLAYGAVLLIADQLARRGGVEPSLEAAMRYAMARPMGFDEWRSVFSAAAAGDQSRSLLGYGRDDTFAADHPVARCVATLTGASVSPSTVGELLVAVSPSRSPASHAGPAIREAALALVGQSRAMATHALCHVVEVRELPEGGWEVRYRRISGTGFNEATTRRFRRRPNLREGILSFWNLGTSALPIPRWLAWYDGERASLRTYAGRGADGRLLYGSPHPAVPDEPSPEPWEGTPAYLLQARGVTERLASPARPSDRGFDLDATPMSAPDRRSAGREEYDSNETKALRRNEVEAAIRDILAQGAVALQANVHPTLQEDDRTMVMRVLTGRNMLVHKRLEPDRPIIVGRSPSHADFVVEHPKVSRRNTRVWVDSEGRAWASDLGSTNGTRLNGQPLKGDAVRVGPEDVLQVGPELLRLERMDDVMLQRIERILRHGEDPERDVLTGMLSPAQLNMYLQVVNGRFPPGYEVTCIVVAVDQLSAIHAKNGQEIADTVFRNVVRLVMLEMADPTLCTRLGYGEMLVVLRGESSLAAVDLAELFIEAVDVHVWLPSALEVSVTCGVSEAVKGETIDSWIERARRALQRGAERRTRRVYVDSGR